MNIKGFFSEVLGQALELGIGTPDDVLRHVTPDLLAQHLPRPLWARLLTACLGAPKVDAQLVIETIGIPNLCEHVPGSVMWTVIAEIAARALGKDFVTPTVEAAPVVVAVSKSSPMPAPEKRAVLAPPPDARETPPATPVVAGPIGPSIPAPVNQPLADLISELEQDERPMTPSRGRTATSQRFRQSNTGIGSRLGSTQPRRPQAAAPLPPNSTPPSIRGARRGSTEVEELESDAANWRDREIAVDDSQLVDWQSTETTQAAVAENDDFSDIGRKR